MPRPPSDKTIQVPAELHEHIRTLASKEAKILNVPSLSMAAYLRRITKFK